MNHSRLFFRCCSALLAFAIFALSSCNSINGFSSSSKLVGVQRVAVVNAVNGMTRFHQGITVFDNVFRHEASPQMDEALHAAVSSGLAGRFTVVNTSVPPEYQRGRGNLPPVPGVDAIVVVRSGFSGLSEPDVATQGYGTHTTRLFPNATAFAKLQIVFYDARTGKRLTSCTTNELYGLVGVGWKKDWEAYTPAERDSIHRSILGAFNSVRHKLERFCMR
jgi:hypothetical protein